MTELDQLKGRASRSTAAAQAERRRLYRKLKGLPAEQPFPTEEQAEVERLEADTRGIRKMMAVLDHTARPG